jgi:hypothetical protein
MIKRPYNNRNETVGHHEHVNRGAASADIGVGLPRLSTMICCRSTRISASSAARDRNQIDDEAKYQSDEIRHRAQRRPILYVTQPDSIYDRDSCLGAFQMIDDSERVCSKFRIEYRSPATRRIPEARSMPAQRSSAIPEQW